MFFKQLRQRWFGRCRHDMNHWIAKRVGKRLGLDAEQQAKFAHAQSELVAARADLQRERAMQHNVVDGLLRADTLDRTRVTQLIDRVMQTVNTRIGIAVPAIGDFYDSLNAAQRAQVREFWARRGSGRHRFSCR